VHATFRVAVAAAVFGWLSPSARAGPVLHLDAAGPGPNPAAQWDDLSGGGHHFTNVGAGHDPVGQAYLFGGPDPANYCCNAGAQDGPYRGYLERAGAGAAFNLETDVVGAGQGTPFSVVAWLEVTVDVGDDFPSTLLQKGPDRNTEWKVRPRRAGSVTELIFNETSPQMFARSIGTPTGFHLLMITHDGSGAIAGTKIYFNGALQPQSIPIDQLATSILSSAAVRIGAGHDVGASSGFFFEGKLGFLELWDEVLDAQYAVDRYDGGNPARAAPPPPPPLLLLLDASDPGPNPATTWQDLSGRGNHFTNVGAAQDAAADAYCFGGPDPGRTAGAGGTNGGSVDGPFDAYLQLAGSDADFDFETDVVAGTGNGDPFTVLAWLDLGVDPGDDFASVLLQKGSTTQTEWKIRPRSVGGNTEFLMNEGFQANRLLTRASPTPVDYHAVMITHDGSGRAEGTKFYFNGVEATREDFDNTLLHTILNNAPLRIGAGFELGSGVRFFEGKLGVLEIWGGVRTQQYAFDRFIELNGGPLAPAAFQDMTAQLAPGLSGQKAAWGDFNRDGYPDLVSGETLWQNNGGTGFTPLITGLDAGVWGDYDNDGYLDIFFWDDLRSVYRNTSGTGLSSLGTPHPPAVEVRGAAWGDWDDDGFLDLYIGGYQHFDNYEADIILENNGGVSFSMGWQETEPHDPGRGITACDFDRDGDLDIYVSNYRLEDNLLWRNNGSGVFQNVSGTFGSLGGAAHTIGSAWGDLDNDGFFDLFVGNFAHPGQPESQFLKNTGPGGSYHFQDMSATARLHFQESYASPTLGDFDNDGDLDLFFTTVYAQTQTSGGVLNTAVLYRNNGNFDFTDVTLKEGLGGVQSTYQGAWADFDLDGDLDLVTGSRIYVNGGNSNHWLEVRLDGRRRGVNAAAIGAQVKIQLGGQVLVRQVEGGTGEGNQNDLVLHFGLGTNDAPVDIEIFWPGGATEQVDGVAVDQLVELPLPLKPDLVGIGSTVPGIALQWQSEPNRLYRIETCGTLGQPFTELVTVPSTGPVTSYTDSSAGIDAAFYRIVVEQD
jgi:hypothetical protein